LVASAQLGDRRSKNNEMSTPLWKKLGSKERYKMKKEDGKEDKKCGKG